MFRVNVNEMNVKAVDLIDELRKTFNLASTLRQSYTSAQYCATFCIVLSWTPRDASPTSSCSGHRAPRMRLRSSVSSASGSKCPAPGTTAAHIYRYVAHDDSHGRAERF